MKNVVVSKAQQARLAQLYQIDPSEIYVIPPGFDPAITGQWTDLTRRLVADLNLLDAEALFLLPARITRRKNIEFAIRILDEMRRISNSDLRLIVTGPPGPHNPTNIAYLESLHQWIEQAHLKDAVYLLYQLGENPPQLVDDDPMANLYGLCDALLFPSREEGFGIPILEAGFSRMPVYCSDLPPFQESGKAQIHPFSLSTPPHKIANAILGHLLQDPTFILRHRVRMEYTWKKIVQQKLIALIERILNA